MRGRRVVLRHRNFHDTRTVAGKRGLDRVGDLVGPRYVVAPGTTYFGQLVEAWIVEIDADVALFEKLLLLELLGTVRAVVEYDGDQRNFQPHRGIDFARGVHEPAVTLDADRRAVGASDLGAQPHAVAHAESALACIVEEG